MFQADIFLNSDYLCGFPRLSLLGLYDLRPKGCVTSVDGVDNTELGVICVLGAREVLDGTYGYFCVLGYFDGVIELGVRTCGLRDDR